MGDDQEEEDDACPVSAHHARAAADISRTMSLHNGWRALLGGTLPVLLSAGRAQPSRRRDGEDSVSALVTDISKAACSFSCVMRPGFLVNSAVLSYVLVYATDVTSHSYLSLSACPSRTFVRYRSR